MFRFLIGNQSIRQSIGRSLYTVTPKLCVHGIREIGLKYKIKFSKVLKLIDVIIFSSDNYIDISISRRSPEIPLLI